MATDKRRVSMIQSLKMASNEILCGSGKISRDVTKQQKAVSAVRDIGHVAKPARSSSDLRFSYLVRESIPITTLSVFPLEEYDSSDSCSTPFRPGQVVLGNHKDCLDSSISTVMDCVADDSSLEDGEKLSSEVSESPSASCTDEACRNGYLAAKVLITTATYSRFQSVTCRMSAVCSSGIWQ